MYKFALRGRFGRISLYTIILFVFFLTACDRTVNNPNPTPQAASLLIHLTRTPTQTPTVTAIPTAIPEVTASPTMLPVSPTAKSPTPVTPTAVNTSTSTPTLLPSATAIPKATRTPPPTLTPTLDANAIALRLLAERNPKVLNANQPRMIERVKLVQAELRSMVFQINESGESGVIDCPEFQQNYAQLLRIGLHFNASPEFQLPNFYYNRAVERGIIQLHIVDEACQSDVRWQYNPFPITEFETEALIELFTNANEIIWQIHEAMAWLVGDVGRTRALYEGVRDQVQEYGTLLDEGVTENCSQLHQIYQSLSQSQRLLPPPEFRRPYQFYLEAIDHIIEWGNELDEQCRPFASANNGGSQGDRTPLSAEVLTVARNGQVIAERLIGEAIRLMPEPTVAPTTVPVTARVLRVSPSRTPGFYNIVLRINLLNTIDAEEIRVGGFIASPSRIIIVRHTCEKDFLDHIEVIDSNGQIFSSPKYAIERQYACDS